jgi:hypothetical protein
MWGLKRNPLYVTAVPVLNNINSIIPREQENRYLINRNDENQSQVKRFGPVDSPPFLRLKAACRSLARINWPYFGPNTYLLNDKRH